MNQPSDQEKRENQPKPQNGQPEVRHDQPRGDAKARGQGETPAANSPKPKERSPRQENL